MDLPVTFDRSFAGEYGWISPFIVEVKNYLRLKETEIPSKEPTLIPLIVEKAVEGIITEGRRIQKVREAEELARVLKEKQNGTMEGVWETCAYLYTLESFLYKRLNAAMRLVGDKAHEMNWRSTISTLGPYCLLLWDDPFNRKLVLNVTLYRGAELHTEQITKYVDALNNKGQYGSFQAFTSCSRSRRKSEQFGNCLFIMNVEFAFITDISSLSEYQDEEEEIITPGVCFRVGNIEQNSAKGKHIIYLILRQRFSGKYDDCFQS